MVPRANLQLDSAVPLGYRHWTPRQEDISDEGFGYFRDTWLIRRVGVRAAREVLRIEQELIAVADACSATAEEFDEIATALEVSDLDEIPTMVVESAAFQSIADYYDPSDGQHLVGGLDLGVAGVVYALAAAGCWPAASCRSHGPGGWSRYPAVYLAADRHRTLTLQPLVEAAGCGFDCDPDRDKLLVVIAPSVMEMMRLAERILEVRQSFIPRRGPRPPKRSSGGIQLHLDLDNQRANPE